MRQHHYPIAFCHVHGFFPATVIEITDSNLAFLNVKVNCPQCGAMCEILPGRYESVAGRLNLLLDESVSPKALAHLKGIVERLQRNEITPAQAKAEAETVAPKAGKLFDIADWSDTAKATLYAAIIGGISLVAAAKMSSSGAAPAPQVVIERVIERRTETLRDSTSLPYIPVPTPRPK